MFKIKTTYEYVRDFQTACYLIIIQMTDDSDGDDNDGDNVHDNDDQDNDDGFDSVNLGFHLSTCLTSFSECFKY